MTKKTFFYLINGKSMIPFLRSKDIGIFERVFDIDLFSVYLFNAGKAKKPAVHRLVRIDKKKLFFHGDNAASFFECGGEFLAVPKKEIKGKLVKIIRHGKKIEGSKFRILSGLSLIYSSVKVLPFLIKKILNKSFRKKQ